MRMLTLSFSIKFSDYGATIVSQLYIRTYHNFPFTTLNSVLVAPHARQLCIPSKIARVI